MSSILDDQNFESASSYSFSPSPQALSSLRRIAYGRLVVLVLMGLSMLLGVLSILSGGVVFFALVWGLIPLFGAGLAAFFLAKSVFGLFRYTPSGIERNPEDLAEAHRNSRHFWLTLTINLIVWLVFGILFIFLLAMAFRGVPFR